MFLYQVIMAAMDIFWSAGFIFPLGKNTYRWNSKFHFPNNK